MQPRVSGLPVQFVTVVLISTMLIIYLFGWSAQTRVEARTVLHRTAAFGEPLLLKHPNDINKDVYIEAEKQPWERVALFICPLH